LIALQKNIESIVSGDVLAIRNLILDSIKGIESVILTGSIARGEAAYTFRDSELILLSDYDIIVVVKNRALPLAISKSSELEALISSRVGRKVSIGAVPRLFWKRAPRTTFFYGIKRTGKTLYGKNILGEIPINEAHDIEKEDGLSILFNYLNQLLGIYVPSNSGFFQMKSVGNGSILSTSSRAILSSAEALLVLEGKYDPSLKRRTQLLETEARDRLMSFVQTYPEFPDLLSTALRIRDAPSQDCVDSYGNPQDFWFRSKECLLELTRYYLEEHFQIHADENTDVIHHYTAIPDRISRNIQYFLLKSIFERKLTINANLFRHSIRRRFQSAVFLLASSLEEDRISGEELRCATDLVSEFLPSRTVPRDSPMRSWLDLRTEVATYWRLASPVLGI